MQKTDWTQYYTAPYKTSSVTRKITARVLIQTIHKYISPETPICLTELGGANSAFLEQLLLNLNLAQYEIVDSNHHGLEKTKERIAEDDPVNLVQEDILAEFSKEPTADLVVSVGLIEHFDENGTQKAVKAHFDRLKPGGIAVITFPTPTWLYRASRKIVEWMGKWVFHDERPLVLEEVHSAAFPHAELLEHRIIWPIVFTQGVAVFKKRSL